MQSPGRLVNYFIAYLLTSLSLAEAFNFTWTTPSSCQPITISWTGGTPPYNVLFTPAFDVTTNISIPLNATNSYVIPQLPVNATDRFVISMSDAKGFGFGGVSPVLQSSGGSPSCLKRPNLPFTFEARLALTQCGDFQFSAYQGAALPVHFFGLIPEGTPFELPSSPTYAPVFHWTADITAGTEVMFIAVDAKGRSGGTSDLLTVVASNNAGCLNGNDPSSTVGSVASPTVTGGNQGGKSKTGAIAGGVVGGVVAVLLLGLLTFILLRRRSRQQQSEEESEEKYDNDGSNSLSSAGHLNPLSLASRRRSHRQTGNSVRPLRSGFHSPAALSPSNSMAGGQNLEPNPFFMPVAESEHSSSEAHIPPVPPLPNAYRNVATSSLNPNPTHQRGHSRQISNSTNLTQSASQSQAGPMSRDSKTLSGGPSSRRNTITRYVLHTDIEDTLDGEVESEEVVELPPTYRPSRGRASTEEGRLGEDSSTDPGHLTRDDSGDSHTNGSPGDAVGRRSTSIRENSGEQRP